MKIKRLTKPIINPSPYPITCIGIINNSNGIILIFFFEKEPKIESKNKGKKKIENIRIIEKFRIIKIKKVSKEKTNAKEGKKWINSNMSGSIFPRLILAIPQL